MNQESPAPNNEKENTFEATNTSNRIRQVPPPTGQPVRTETAIIYASLQTRCKGRCADDPNFKKCVDDCMKQHTS